MNNLIDKISQDLVSAQKGRDEVAVSTLRMLLSDIKNAQIEKGGELSDGQTIEVIQKSAKRHRESIDAYKKGQRGDLVDRETAELKILEEYLPEQLDDNEIARIVDEVILQTDASGLGDTGKVMGQVMGRLKGQADGNVVSLIVKKKLNK